MKLIPKTPAGRSNRKARAFTAEIARLCRDGYGCAAIQEALAEAGMQVSLSTVQREVVRAARQPLPTTVRGLGTAAQPASPRPAPSHSVPPPVLADKSLSSRNVAEEFVKSRITNPLVRSKERP